jgi:hypothetical protein
MLLNPDSITTPSKLKVPIPLGLPKKIVELEVGKVFYKCHGSNKDLQWKHIASNQWGNLITRKYWVEFKTNFFIKWKKSLDGRNMHLPNYLYM